MSPCLLKPLYPRLVDVSSIDELAWRWNTRVSSAKPRSKGTHTAMADIRDSLELLRYYKKRCARSQGVV